MFHLIHAQGTVPFVHSENAHASEIQILSDAQISFVARSLSLFMFPSAESFVPSQKCMSSKSDKFSLSIPDSLLFSDRNLPSDMRGFSLITFSGGGFFASSPPIVGSDGSAAKVGLTSLPLVGAISGLLALMAAFALVIMVQGNRRQSEAIDEDPGVDLDMIETMAAFESNDDYKYLTQARTDELILLPFGTESSGE
jgi:hypothetical protein